jgi:uncharacterized protein (DUF2235 family)
VNNNLRSPIFLDTLAFSATTSADDGGELDMGKRIVVLSDGTGNSAAKVWRTNVWRLFQALDLKKSDQIAIYDDGVGTSSFKPLALLGGAFGVGLKRNVLGLYVYLCRNYRSQNDYYELERQSAAKENREPQAIENFSSDEIFLFGFSRGAFTVRVLAALVLTQGLVRFSSEADLSTRARAAYRAYRFTRYPNNTIEGLFRPLRTKAATQTHDPNQRPVDEIRFIGVWDTVAAYGSPLEEITLGFSKYIWPLELPNHQLHSKIHRARQALAIDEERTTFAPVLWTELDEPMAKATQDERLSQVWFAGVHSNVGGGYPDDALANVSLNWMMAEAADCDLRFKREPEDEPDARKEARAAQDKDGRLYDSRSGLGGYYRYGPRNISRFFAAACAPLKNKRVPKIHESVIDRIQVGAHLYAPIGLPAEYAVVTGDAREIRLLGTGTSETGSSAADRHREQESVWNGVWRRRAIYFLTVFASLYMALYPLIRESYAYQEMATRLRVVADAIKLTSAFLPSGADRWVQGYARDPAWFLLWAFTIGFLIWYGSTIKTEITSRMRRIWDDNLPDRMSPGATPAPSRGWQVAWRALLVALVYLATYPVFTSTQWLSFLTPPEPFDSMIRRYTEQPLRFAICAFLLFHLVPESAIQKLRTSDWYVNLLQFLKFKFAPLFFAIFIVLGALAVISHLMLNVRDSFGAFCKHTTNERGPLNAGNDGFPPSGPKRIEFDSSLTDDRSLCLPLGVFAQRGRQYTINVRRDPPDVPWTFWDDSNFMSGQPISRMEAWKQPIALFLYPFRRSLDRPWGAFIVRYGPTGNEESFLDRDPPALDDELADPPGSVREEIPSKDERLGEGWTARRDGELYVYLNKPTIGFPWIETLLGRAIGNTGKAQITVQRR